MRFTEAQLPERALRKQKGRAEVTEIAKIWQFWRNPLAFLLPESRARNTLTKERPAEFG